MVSLPISGTSSLWIGIGVGVLSVIAVLLFVFFLAYYYASDREHSVFAKIIFFVGVVLVLLCIALVPLDIYNTSHTALELVAERARYISIAYYVLYALIIFMTFFVIPFGFFYYKDPLDDEKTVAERCSTGAKYTAALVAVAIIVLVIGIFLQGSIPSAESNPGVSDYLNSLLNSENHAQAAISFCLFCIMIIGFVFCYLPYTSYGLVALPIRMIRGRRGITDETQDVEEELSLLRLEKQAIHERYGAVEDPSSKMSRRDREKLRSIEDKEATLNRREVRLLEIHTTCNIILEYFRPFQLIIGVALLVIAAMLLITVIISQIDRTIYSSCGIRCGFLVEQGKLPNPLDLLLTYSSIFFPLDYITFVFIVAYLFLITVNALVSIGVRAIVVPLYRVKARRTTAQALCLSTLILSLAVLTILIQLVSFAPRYVTFGARRYIDSDGVSQSCSLSAGAAACPMTVLATTVSRMTLALGIFGAVFYFITWIFVASTIIIAIVVVVQGKRSNLDEVDSDVEMI